jgi:Cft2 family RNA processing exonuclease
MTSNLSFLGASGTVTGSRFLLAVNGRQYLIDCGLFQGGRSEKALNWEPFPVAPDRIDGVLLTHAHIDHVGYLPRLVQQGFHGPVYATEASHALLDIVLPDSAHLQEQGALYANKKGYSRHKPALPLYTSADAEATLKLIRGVRFDQPLTLDGVTVTWRPAGHILGSATLDVQIANGSDTRFVRDVEEPKLLNTRAGPAVIISASGMVNGGRIMHHLKWRLPDARNALLFVGYQAEGTKGRLLLEGAKRIRIHGEEFPVRARIFQAHALSAHADRDEILRWLGGFSRPPRRVFVVHGEPKRSLASQEQIHSRFGWEATAPKIGDVHEIV